MKRLRRSDAVMDDSLYDLWTDFPPPSPKTKIRKNYWRLACGTRIQSVRFSQEAGFDVTWIDLRC